MIVDSGVRLVVGEPLDGKIYNLGSRKVCEFERVDTAKLVSGFNDMFAREGGDSWTISSLSAEMQITAPAGYQRELFKIQWKIVNRSGRSVQRKSVAQGTGVNIKWGNDEAALARDANVAFAEAILRLVVESVGQRPE